MIHSRHLQQCISLTLGAIATGLAIKYRNQIWNYFWQNQRQNFDHDIWIIYSGPQTLNWINNNFLPNLANKNIALDTFCGIPGKYISNNILKIASKSERVVIVLGPDLLENRWLRYQIEVALQKGPEKITAYSREIIGGQNARANYMEQLRLLNVPQMHQILQNPNVEYHFEYDFWVVYSGLRSQRWVLNKLLPTAEKLDRTVAFDIVCYIPGKNNFENIKQTAQKSRKVIIILGQEIDPNEFFRYEIEHALMKGPQDVLVCQFGPLEKSERRLVTKFPCLEPLCKIQIHHAQPSEELLHFLSN